jgi:hypothetical protein
MANAFTAIGDLGSLQAADLIFIYPIIFDSKLEKKYKNLIRDFQTLQFISQIKVANILNLTKSAVKKEDSPDCYVSPAETLSGILNADNNDALYRYQIARQQNINPNYNKPHPRELEAKLNEKYQFIRAHLQTDPRYSDLNPFVSMITVEDTLIEIPLIIGTKIEKINSQGIFWLLFLAAATGLPLNDARSITNISNNLDRIPRRRYLEIIGNTNFIIQNPPSYDSSKMDFDGPTAAKAYTRLRAEAMTDLKKAGSKFSRIAGNISDFQTEVGISTAFNSKEQIQYSNIVQNMNNAQFKTEVTSLLSQALQTSAFRVIQTYNNIIIDPNVEVDLSVKYKKLHQGILDIAEVGGDGIFHLVANKVSKPETAVDFLNQFNSSCSALSNIQPANEIGELSQLVLTYSNIRDSIANNSNTAFSDINEFFKRTATSLSNKAEQITRLVHNFTTGGDGNTADFKAASDSAKRQIVELLTTYYYGTFGADGGPIITDRNTTSNIFRMVYNLVANDQGKFDRFMSDYIQFMADVIHFMYLFASVGYVCKSMKVVENKIKIEEASAVSFPNYTFVIPIEYLRTLYFALASRNIKAVADNQNLDKELEKFNLNENEIFRILSTITERLKIPNIVVIDEKARVAYYKWVFSKRLLKVNLSTIEGYIRSQKDVLRV